MFIEYFVPALLSFRIYMCIWTLRVYERKQAKQRLRSYDQPDNASRG